MSIVQRRIAGFLAFAAIFALLAIAQTAHQEDLTARGCRIEVKSSGSTLPDYVCDRPLKP